MIMTVLGTEVEEEITYLNTGDVWTVCDKHGESCDVVMFEDKDHFMFVVGDDLITFERD